MSLARKSRKMNNKETAKIRRRFAPDKNDISIIQGCYVSEKGEIVSTFAKSPLFLPESELQHYFSAFKKILGGIPNRNQFSIPVHTEEEAGMLLRQLQKSELQDENALSIFYKKVIEKLEIEGSYLILIMHDAYSIPYKNTDEHPDKPDFDGTVFNYIIASICPVKLTKPQLTFFSDDRDFHTVDPDLTVGSPALGFMYPILSDGGADVNAALYYTKDAANIHADFIDSVFNVIAPNSIDDQRQVFYGVLADTLEQGVTFDVVQTLHENIVGQMAERKKDAAPLQISRKEIASLLDSCDVPASEQDKFQESYLEQFGAVGMEAQTIVEPKKFEITTENAVIQVDSDRSDLVEVKRIDGRRYILIAVEGDVTINGIEVNIP